MCMTCGCNKIHDKHGDERHITWEDIQKAAQASNINMDQCWENMRKGMEMAKSETSSRS